MKTLSLSIAYIFAFHFLGGLADISDQWSSLWSRSKNDDKRKNINHSHHSGSSILETSDLRPLDRRIWVITTACLPWMTGTSINPLLRAAYLAKERPAGKVTLMVPWLPDEDQNIAFPKGVRFTTPEEQKAYVKKWLVKDANLPIAAERLDIVFYAARYHDEFHSIFPMGDLVELIPDNEADVCILEEPEHLNWFRAPFTAKDWKLKFKHVIGVMHTNYLMYSRSQTGGLVKEQLLYVINQAMCRAYCHKIIKLSGALQLFAPEKEEISNVHGVRNQFIIAGDQAALSGFSKGIYFVGKMAWQKGLGELFELMKYTEKRTTVCLSVDIYGHGPHETEIKEAAQKDNLNVTFHGPRDHLNLTDYKIFINPSISEVLCTTVAEALAMGKWVICAQHPSNVFFEQFPNCLTYRTNEEFAANLLWAMNNDPAPLSAELRYALSWDAAMERFISASTLTTEMHRQSKNWEMAELISKWTHDMVGSGAHGDAMRLLAGGGSVSHQIEYIRTHGSALPKVGRKDEGNGGTTTNDVDTVAMEGKTPLPRSDYNNTTTDPDKADLVYA